MTPLAQVVLLVVALVVFLAAVAVYSVGAQGPESVDDEQ